MTLTEAEQILSAAYRAEADLYAEALEAAQGVGAGLEQGTESVASLERLRQALDQVARIEGGLNEAKAIWQTRAGRARSPLPELLDKVAQRIQALHVAVDRAALLGQRRKTDLGPQFDDLIRRRQMRRAYRASEGAAP